jgi:Protein of unknown function (DUF3592)
MNTEIMMIILGGGFIVSGAMLWQKGNHLLKNGKRANAIIFKNNYTKSGGNEGSYFPVVRFLTDKQEWITQELSIGYTPAKPEGMKLEVIYDPEEPTTVEIYSIFQLEILPRLLVATGIIFLIFGALEYLNFTQVMANK